MNAMMTKKCIERGARVSVKKSHGFFYNPMWGLFGDRTDGPAGTYYHANSANGQYGWNMLDQVLLRPSDGLLAGWREDSDGRRQSALHKKKSGRPDGKLASDHFPILLTLRPQ